MRSILLTLLPFVVLLFSCGQNGKTTVSDSFSIPDSLSVPVPPANGVNFHAGMQVDCKTFEVKDSATSAPLGWGYDLYVGVKKVIHQPIMPAAAGTNAFHSEEDARKIGELAAKRFGATGSFPTIYLRDYDSLKISYSK